MAQAAFHSASTKAVTALGGRATGIVGSERSLSGIRVVTGCAIGQGRAISEGSPRGGQAIGFRANVRVRSISQRGGVDSWRAVHKVDR